MTQRRRYTKAEKMAAVVAAELSTPAAAAEAQGVPESSLRYWLDDPKFAELRTKTREETAGAFHVLAHLAMDRLRELVPTMEPRDLTVLLGVATDKAALLSGQPTSRTETRALTEGLDDHEKARLREILDEALSAEDVPT